MSRGRRRAVRQPRCAPGAYDDAYSDSGAYGDSRAYGDSGAYGDPYAGTYDASYYDDADEGYYRRRRRRGIVTPTRFLLVLLIVGSGAVALYGIFLDRTRLQMPLTVSGLAVFGIGLAVLALMSARGAASLGSDGRGGAAVLAALFGGLCAFGASGSLAGALVLGILASTS